MHLSSLFKLTHREVYCGPPASSKAKLVVNHYYLHNTPKMLVVNHHQCLPTWASPKTEENGRSDINLALLFMALKAISTTQKLSILKGNSNKKSIWLIVPLFKVQKMQNLNEKGLTIKQKK